MSNYDEDTICYQTESDDEEPEEAEEEVEYARKTTKLSATIAYYIGVEWEKCCMIFDNEEGLFEELSKDPDSRAIRSLCRIRTNLMKHFDETNRGIKYDLKGLDDYEWYKDDLKILSKQEIYLLKNRRDPNGYIADINKLLSEKIGKIRKQFPDWIDWEYIKSLFTIPKGQKTDVIISESKKFIHSKSLYPYQKYIYWDPYDVGNMLLNDFKFAKVLYDQHDDYFDDYSKVRDAKESIVTSIYDFIDDSETVELHVDCENSDVFKLASVLKKLDSSKVNKIHRIVLYDDVHTTTAWRYLDKMTDVPVEHNIIERVKEEKSLVDIKMAVGITKASLQDGVSSFILLSSDSDFWGVISSISAEFLVMVEREKCGIDIQNKLIENGTYYCFMDDFCSGNISKFKNNILRTEMEKRLNKLINVNAKEMCESVFFDLRINASDAEKQNFYEKAVKKASIQIDKNNNFTINLPEI